MNGFLICVLATKVASFPLLAPSAQFCSTVTKGLAPAFLSLAGGSCRMMAVMIILIYQFLALCSVLGCHGARPRSALKLLL